jgi:ribosomal protein S18 acetylase RimI-like enzyme
MNIEVRRGSLEDAGQISEVINSVVEEGRFTSLKKHTAEEERAFMESLGDREAIFIALVGGKVVGIQSLTEFAKWSDSMSHVGNILTLVREDFRGKGVGRKLAEKTLQFARDKAYKKISTYIIADNQIAVEYYKSLGFEVIGKWKDQVKIGQEFHDDLIVELFL